MTVGVLRMTNVTMLFVVEIHKTSLSLKLAVVTPGVTSVEKNCVAGCMLKMVPYLTLMKIIILDTVQHQMTRVQVRTIVLEGIIHTRICHK